MKKIRPFVGWTRINSKYSSLAKEFYVIFNSNHEFNYCLKISGVRKLLQKKYPNFVESFDVLVEQFHNERQLQIMRYRN